MVSKLYHQTSFSNDLETIALASATFYIYLGLFRSFLFCTNLSFLQLLAYCQISCPFMIQFNICQDEFILSLVLKHAQLLSYIYYSSLALFVKMTYLFCVMCIATLSKMLNSALENNRNKQLCNILQINLVKHVWAEHRWEGQKDHGSTKYSRGLRHQMCVTAIAEVQYESHLGDD